MNLRTITVAVLILMVGVVVYWQYARQNILPTIPADHSDAVHHQGDQPDPEKYARLKKQLAEKRLQLAHQYQSASTTAQKNIILQSARKTLESHLLEMTHCWRGTPWDFNGTCKSPGAGKIACGYFVSTVLQDAGVKCERIRLAQQPSQRIIATFLTRNEMLVRAGLSYDDFLKQEIARGPGWRIVGLDRHVGFLVVEATGKTRFIHSNPGNPAVVIDEPREHSAYLRNSNYRVTGNITANKKFLQGWLLGKTWPTKTRP